MHKHQQQTEINLFSINTGIYIYVHNKYVNIYVHIYIYTILHMFAMNMYYTEWKWLKPHLKFGKQYV